MNPDCIWKKQSEDFLKTLNASQHIAFLTGAGVSVDSGIPDFQTLDSSWPFDVDRAEATSLAYFHRDPQRFWQAFRYIFTLKQDVKPNLFHRAVASLEQKGRQITVLTQNVDGLHADAGNTHVLELHGNIRQARCGRASCGYRCPLDEIIESLPRCRRCGKIMRPDAVLFGEQVRHMEEAEQAVLEADLLIVAGTALEVGPVNELPHYREWRGVSKATAWLNQSKPAFGYNFSLTLQGPLSRSAEVLEQG